MDICAIIRPPAIGTYPDPVSPSVTMKAWSFPAHGDGGGACTETQSIYGNNHSFGDGGGDTGTSRHDRRGQVRNRGERSTMQANRLIKWSPMEAINCRTCDLDEGCTLPHRYSYRCPWQWPPTRRSHSNGAGYAGDDCEWGRQHGMNQRCNGVHQRDHGVIRR